MHLAIELDDKKVIQKYHKEFTDLETQIHEYQLKFKRYILIDVGLEEPTTPVMPITESD